MSKKQKKTGQPTSGSEVPKEPINERYFSKSIIQSSPAYFVAIDAEGKTKVMNQTMLKALGYNSDEVIGTDYITTFIPEKDHKMLSEVFAKLINFDEQTVSENRVLTKDGRELFVEWHCQPVYDTDNRFDFFFGVGVDITKRKQAEEALRKSEEKLSAMLQSLGDHMSMMDKDLNIIWANDVAKGLFGDDIVGKKCYEVYHGRNKPCEPFPCITLKAFEDNQIHEHETQVYTLGGKTLTYACTANVALRDDEGNSTGVIEISRDITKRKQAESKLRESENKFRSITENAVDFIFIKDKARRYTFVNKAMQEMLGLPEEEILGKTPEEIYGPEQEHIIQEVDNRTFFGESVNETRSLVIGDKELYFNTLQTPLTMENGEVTSIMGIVRDITKRKKAEKALKKSEANLRNILEHSTNIFYSHTPDHILTYFSPQIEKLLGYTPEEVMVKWTELVSDNPINEEGFQKTVAAIESGRTQLPYELELVHKNGKKVIVEVREAPIVKDGKTIAIVGALADITERKRAEIELQTAQHFSDSIIHSLPGLFYIFDKESTRFLRRNDNWTGVTGYSDEELYAMTLLDFFTKGADRDKCALRVQEVYDTGYSTMENNLLTKSGDKIPYYFTGRRLIIDEKTYLAGMAIDISERKRAEEKLRKSEEKFSKVADYSYDWEYWINPEGKFTYVSPSCKRITGYSVNEFLQNPKLLLTIVHSDDVHLVKNHKHKALESGGVEPIEFRIITKSGEERWIGHVCQTVYDSNGPNLGQRGCNRDITMRKQAEEALRESEEKYLGIFEGVNDAIFLHDSKTGQIVSVNNKACEMYGYTRNELTKLYIPDLTANDQQINKKILEDGIQIIREGVKTSRQWQAKDKEGKTFWVEVNPSIITIGKKDWLLVSVRDITERKRAGKALRESEQQYKSVVENAGEFIWQVDTEGKFVFFNNYAEKVSGQKSADWQGKHYSPLIHSDDLARVNKIHENVVAGNMIEYETRIVVAEEKIVDLEIQSMPIYKNGEVTATLSFGRDITERKQAEKALRERERMLDALINAPTESAFLVDSTGIVLAANRIGAKRFGKKEDEIIGLGIYDFLSPKLAKSRKAKADQVMRSGKPIRFQDEREGRYFDINIYPVFDDKGKVAALAINAQDITRHRQAEIMLRSLVEGTAKATGQDFFNKLVEHLTTALNCQYAIIGVLDDSEPKQITTLSFWNKNKIGKNFSFDIAGTPCENIDKRNICFYQSQTSKKFPKDKWLTKNKIEAYLGISILDPKNKPLGILVVMDTRKISDDLIDGAHSLMAIFSSRAAAELERISAEDEQREIADRLREEQTALFHKNVALKQILEHMETEKLDFKHEISSGIEQALMPFVKKLYKKDRGLSKKDIEQFEDIIKSITGTKIDDFKANYAKLTSREMDICELIKKGKSSQEIADSLHLSIQTIQKHRSSIRKKLQLKNKEINLPAYLRYK